MEITLWQFDVNSLLDVGATKLNKLVIDEVALGNVLKTRIQIKTVFKLEGMSNSFYSKAFHENLIYNCKV